MIKHYPPKFGGDAFNCVYCGVYSVQHWTELYVMSSGVSGRGFSVVQEWSRCMCKHCAKVSYWYKQAMIVPTSASVPLPHPDFPAEAVGDYEEARDIAGRSPKAAAALLRLCLQKLMPFVGEKGKNINDDIAALVKRGVPVYVQQALDFCRVVGNNAVHPGEIVLDDTPDVALALFEMLNLIVEQSIAVPKRLQAQYNMLPDGARAAIEKRDAKALGSS